MRRKQVVGQKKFFFICLILFVVLGSLVYPFREALFWQKFVSQGVTFWYPKSWKISSMDLQYPNGFYLSLGKYVKSDSIRLARKTEGTTLSMYKEDFVSKAGAKAEISTQSRHYDTEAKVLESNGLIWYWLEIEGFSDCKLQKRYMMEKNGNIYSIVFCIQATNDIDFLKDKLLGELIVNSMRIE